MNSIEANSAIALKNLDDPTTEPVPGRDYAESREDLSSSSAEAPPTTAPPVEHVGTPVRVKHVQLDQPSLFDRVEAFISKLSVRDNFWNSVCSLIWLPLAFFSGIRMKELDANSFVARAVLPFRRFNRNWYRAMAGGALLANSEIAGGAYVFGVCGSDYTVVCKHLEYKFLRPCFGPAVYRIKAREDIKGLIATGVEFNITVDMDILQQASQLGERDKRVGHSIATFHVTPKTHQKARKARRGR